MSDLFAIEDVDNVGKILAHHLGYCGPRNPHPKLTQEKFDALHQDLLRYCTRLRCQPQTYPHTERSGVSAHQSMSGPACAEYSVPGHQLIADDPESVVQGRGMGW